MTPDRIGQQVGKYRLLRLLGRGAFAEVYLGEHLGLKSLAAIKVLYNQLLSSDADAFMKEARTIARLEHPHIVRIFDFEVQNGTPFIVMNYVPNGTLRERHPVGTPVALPTVVSYVRQISDALQYAHNEKVIHRDIKPENMLIDKRGEIVLSDFGIAIVWQSSRYQSTQDIAGTIGYMAPEQFQGHPVPASDQYALGVLVYEWLCGDRPFQGTSIEIAGQHLSATPPSLLTKLPTLPSPVNEVVLTALAKDPKRRFGSIQAFARAFELASQVEPARSHMAQGPQVSSQVMLSNSIPPFELPRQAPPTVNFDAPPFQQPSPIYSGDSSTYVTPPAKKAVAKKRLPVAIPPFPGKTLISTYVKTNGIGKRLLFVALAVLLILAGSLTIFSRRNDNPSVSPQTAVANAAVAVVNSIAFAFLKPTATAAADVYNSAVASNGAMFGFDAQQTRNNPDEKILNSKNVPGLVQYWTGSTSGHIFGSPVVADDIVYVSSENYPKSNSSNLYAFNISKCSSSPCTPQWEASVPGVIYGSPVVYNNFVYVGTYNDPNGKNLYAFDSSYCSEHPQTCQNNGYKWSAVSSDGIVASLTISVASTPNSGTKGILYVGTFNGNLEAFDTSCDASACSPLWGYRVGEHIYSSPTVSNGVVYVSYTTPKSADKGHIFACTISTDLHSCQSLWRINDNNPIYISPIVSGGVLYIVTVRNVEVFALSGCTTSGCSLLWYAKAPFSNNYSFSSAAFAGNYYYRSGYLYVGSTDGSLSVYDVSVCASEQRYPNTCSIEWSSQHADTSIIESSPMVANNVLYIGGSKSYKIEALDAHYCGIAYCDSTPLWTIPIAKAPSPANNYPYDPNVSVSSSPMIVNGVVYIGSYDGTLYAFHVPHTPS